MLYKIQIKWRVILLRTVDIFSLKGVVESQKEANIAIEIDAKGSSLMSIDNIDKSIDIGYNAIMDNKVNLWLKNDVGQS